MSSGQRIPEIENLFPPSAPPLTSETEEGELSTPTQKSESTRTAEPKVATPPNLRKATPPPSPKEALSPNLKKADTMPPPERRRVHKPTSSSEEATGATAASYVKVVKTRDGQDVARHWEVKDLQQKRKVLTKRSTTPRRSPREHPVDIKALDKAIQRKEKIEAKVTEAREKGAMSEGSRTLPSVRKKTTMTSNYVPMHTGAGFHGWKSDEEGKMQHFPSSDDSMAEAGQHTRISSDDQHMLDAGPARPRSPMDAQQVLQRKRKQAAEAKQPLPETKKKIPRARPKKPTQSVQAGAGTGEEEGARSDQSMNCLRSRPRFRLQ